MAGIIIWCILLIVIAACLLPWWFIPSCIVAGALYFTVFNDFDVI